MKKVLLGGLLVLVGIWVLGVVFFGRAAEMKVDDQIAELNKDLMEHSIPVSITRHSYESGILSSSSRIQLTLDRENVLGNDRALSLDVDLNIYHGPLMLTPQGLKLAAYYIAFTPDIAVLLEDKEEAKEFLDGFAERKPLSGGFLLNLWGEQSFDLALAPFHFSEGGKSASLDNGIVGTFSSDDTFSRLKGRVELGALSVEDEAEALTVDIAPSTLIMDVTEIYAGSMLTGKLDYTLDSVIAISNDSEHRIDGIALHSVSDKNSTGLYGNASFIMKSVTSTDDSFKDMFGGPLNFQLDFNYQGLNEQATREFAEINQKINSQMYGALLSGEETPELEGLSEESIQAYLFAIAGLVEQGLKFDYSFTLRQGDASSAFKLTFDWVDASSLMHKKTLREALAAFQADVKLNVDNAFLGGANVRAMAQIPVAMGYAVETGKGIQSQAVLNRGELLLNGQPVPYLEMLGATLDEALPWAQ